MEKQKYGINITQKQHKKPDTSTQNRLTIGQLRALVTPRFRAGLIDNSAPGPVCELGIC